MEYFVTVLYFQQVKYIHPIKITVNLIHTSERTKVIDKKRP